MSIDIEEWKKGIPQRELEQKIREYEEDYPKREKMTPQARENNQTRFFLEDRFYELHKQQLADMLKKQAEENGKVCFREGYSGIVPGMNSYSDGSNVGYTPLPSSPTLGEGVDSANTGLEASALTPASYGTAGGNGGQQVAGGYGNGYAADYVQPVAAAENGQSMFPGGMTPAMAQNLAGGLQDAGKNVSDYSNTIWMNLKNDVDNFQRDWVRNHPTRYVSALATAAPEYFSLRGEDLNDINKHQYLACQIAKQQGDYGENIVNNLGQLKEELFDKGPKTISFYMGNRTYSSLDDIARDSDKDMINNRLGGYYARTEAQRLGGYDKVDCSPLKESALGGKYLDAKYRHKLSPKSLAAIARTEPNPIPFGFLYDSQYNDTYSESTLDDYKNSRYGY